MARIIISHLAREDIIGIWTYIAVDNGSAADGTLNKIRQAIASLADWPERGRKRDELSLELRSLPVGRFLVLYTLLDDKVTVVRVVAGERDLPGLFE